MLTASYSCGRPLFDHRSVAQIMVLTDAAEVNDAMSSMRDMSHPNCVCVDHHARIFVTLVLSGIQLGLGSMILIARRKQLERRATSRRLSKERRGVKGAGGRFGAA